MNIRGRIDLSRDSVPYWSAPPVQFVYESRALLSLGSYTWADVPSVLTPIRPIQDNVVYMLNTITLSADISELDFTSAIATVPQFNMHRESDTLAPFFREAVRMNMFFDNFPFRLVWEPGRGSDQLRASFNGVLTQTANLIGKVSITLKAVVSAQEIQDDVLVEAIKTNHPGGEAV